MALGVRQLDVHVLTRTGDLLIFHSFPLISRYLSGDASDSDSGEDCADDDNDEPEENSNTKSESRENEKFDESDYRKKADSLKAKSTERFRILKETNPEILPVYLNPKKKPVQKQAEQPKDAAEFTCQEPGCGKICSKPVTPENINVVSANNCNPLISCCSSGT